MKTLTVKYQKADNSKEVVITKEIEESKVEAYKFSYKKAIVESYEKHLGHGVIFNDANLGSAEWKEIERKNELFDNLVKSIKFELR